MRDLHTADLPREKLEKYGVQKLSDHELLAILLGSGIEGLNVLELSKKILHTIVLKPRAKKELNSLEHRDRVKINAILDAILFNPFHGKKLQGKLKNQYSVRVWPYRVVYEIRKNQVVVAVIKIGHRGGRVYRT